MESTSKATTLTADQAIRLARTVKGCTAEQMPYIRKILEAANIELPTEEEIDRIVLSGKDPFKGRARQKQSQAKWQDTKDEAVIALRKAYDMNMNFTALSTATGIGRTALYHYMWGDRSIDAETSQLILDKLSEIFAEREKAAS